jgi:hypothetical protein
MNCDWVFLHKNGNKDEETRSVSTPNPGDGAVYNGRSYVVRHVISGRTTTANDAVIATEI